MKKAAVIDLGSNSARLNISCVLNGKIQTLHDDNKYVRLSEGLTNESNTIKPEPALRAVLAISEHIKRCKEFECDDISIVATETVRRADNSDWFIEIVKSTVGLEVDVLSGDDEAYFDCVAIANDTGLNEFLMVDTGGGSTEIALYRDGEVEHSVSFPYGSVVLNEMFSKDKTLSADEFFECLRHVSEGIADLTWLYGADGLPLVMLGGSLRNYYDYANDYTLEEFSELMLSMTVEEREEFGIKSRRSDTITAGLIPCMVVEMIAKPSKILASDCGVKEGYLLKKLYGLVKNEREN